MSDRVVHHHHHTGIGLGSVVAAIVSWNVNHSIGWCIVHGIFGWFYVIYHFACQ